jgi:hypothetical protein
VPHKKFWLGFTLTSLAILTPKQSASPQEVWEGKLGNCTFGARVSPVKQTKEIVNRDFGFSFKIPANYSSEVQKIENQYNSEKFRISILNPADVSFLECSRKNQIRGAGHALLLAYVVVGKIPEGIRNLKDIPQLSPPRIRETVHERREIVIANQPAIIFATQSIYPFRLTQAFVFTPDKQNLIVVSTGAYGRGSAYSKRKY